MLTGLNINLLFQTLSGNHILFPYPFIPSFLRVFTPPPQTSHPPSSFHFLTAHDFDFNSTINELSQSPTPYISYLPVYICLLYFLL